MSFSSLFGARLGPCSGALDPTRRCAPSTPSSASARATSVVYAFAGSGAGDYGTGKTATYERVLRYPDGGERRIRYPVIPAEDPPASESCAEDWETLNAWKDNSRMGGAGMMDLSSRPPPSASSVSTSESFVPASPLALLRLFTSPDHMAKVRQEEKAVRQSYIILSGCPWPVSKPLYVLAAGTGGQTHTLRTRLPMDQVQTEINQILSRNRKNNKYKVDDQQPIIKCSQLVDGVVAFEDEGDAELYGSHLEEDQPTVKIARCDAFDLFKTVNETKGVVILLQRGAEIPLPHRLAASVRSDNSEDKLF